MLGKTLESALDDHFAIVPKDLFEEAQEEAFQALDYEECTEEQCIMMIKEILQVENAFQLVLMEEDGDTQISLTWNDLDQKRVETEYCEGCKTKELIKSIGRLVDKLVGVKKVASKKIESKVVLQTKSKISSVSKLEGSETECTSVCDGLVAYYSFNGDAMDNPETVRMLRCLAPLWLKIGMGIRIMPIVLMGWMIMFNSKNFNLVKVHFRYQ